MAQTKIYPSTQAQVQAVQNTVDEINSKIVTPTYQVKTVTPSNVQQTVQADSGYTALSGVVVNPIAALMPENLEDFISRSQSMPEFSLSLSGDVPTYACYYQQKLVAVYDAPTSIGDYAFNNCILLQDINLTGSDSIGNYSFHNCRSIQEANCKVATSIGLHAFDSCSLMLRADCRNVTVFNEGIFHSCSLLQYVDCRNAVTVYHYAFFNDSQLAILDFTSIDTPPQLYSTAFQHTNDTWKAVVKDNTVKALFQSATNWSVRSSQIYTVAEIEAIVGMTYDEYYLQIFGHARNEVQA